jgi:8-oxo-dGTP pyrophosphatase MutT (NUDIX family)
MKRDHDHGPPDAASDGLKLRIRRRLSSLDHRTHADGFGREAAVLIPVFEREGEPHFLLTRRTEEVETHKGQISFPGGMREENEPLQRTAIRETFEEVGIPEARIEILGRFHDYLSSTGFLVTPFAGFLTEPIETIPQAREVAEVLTVPFRVFLDPGLLRVETVMRSGRQLDVYYYTFGANLIWGLTARIIRDFLLEIEFA